MISENIPVVQYHQHTEMDVFDANLAVGSGRHDAVYDYYGRPAGESDDDDDSYDYSDNEFYFGEVHQPYVAPKPFIPPRLIYSHRVADKYLPELPFALLRELEGACEAGDLQTVEKYKDRFNVILLNKMTPLMTAIRHGQTELVEYLLNHGADARKRSDFYGFPVHTVFQANISTETKKDYLRLLLDSQANIESRDKRGYTPFLRAVECGDMELIKFLQERGAKTDVSAGRGRDAVAIACVLGYSDVLSYFQAESLMPTDEEVIKGYAKLARHHRHFEIAEAFEKFEETGELVFETKRRPPAPVEIDPFDKSVILARSCPSGDLETVDPLTKVGTRFRRGVPIAIRDILVGLELSVSFDRSVLEEYFVQKRKTKIRDILSLDETKLDEFGIKEVGHRFALLDLPFTAMKFDFDAEGIVLDNDTPNEVEMNQFKNCWDKRNTRNRFQKGREIDRCFDLYKSSLTLPDAEAAFLNLSVSFSVMAEHFRLFAKYMDDPKVFVPIGGDVKKEDQGEQENSVEELMIEAMAFMLMEARAMKGQLEETEKAITQEMSRNPCILNEFENQVIVNDHHSKSFLGAAVKPSLMVMGILLVFRKRFWA